MKPVDPLDDCPLSVADQAGNIRRYAVYWCLYYLAAPVSYVGLTHANLLKELGNGDTVANLPHAVYQWLTVVPLLAAWTFPRPRHLKPLVAGATTTLVLACSLVAITLGSGASREVTSLVVMLHGAAFGAASGILNTTLWDMLRRGVSTSRRGRAMGLAFGVGPIFACLGSLLQDSLFQGKLTGLWFGLAFPTNYLAMFAGVVPLLMASAVILLGFKLPESSEREPAEEAASWKVLDGLARLFRNRAVLLAIIGYVLVYSGGNAIMDNVSLEAKEVLPDQDTVGIQSFLRFGCKAVTGAFLGWLLARTNPRATTLATTILLLVGLGWVLTSSGWWFLWGFGLLGAGELFGAYFPNYVVSASPKADVRANVAYLNVLGSVIGFASLGFGLISDRWGRTASFQVAAGMLVVALLLILTGLPANPSPDAPRETL